jgi:hypothetical protein
MGNIEMNIVKITILEFNPNQIIASSIQEIFGIVCSIEMNGLKNLSIFLLSPIIIPIILPLKKESRYADTTLNNE